MTPDTEVGLILYRRWLSGGYSLWDKNFGQTPNQKKPF